MPNTHGGPRPGAGRKPGGRNKIRKIRIKKQVVFTPAEWDTIEPEIDGSFNEFARSKILNKNYPGGSLLLSGRIKNDK